MLRRFRHGIQTARPFGRIPPKTLPEPILALRSQRRRRTALPRQTARARTSIPASQDKTSGTSPRPVSPVYRRRSSERAHVSPFTASPAHRRNPSDTRPCPVHSDFAALFPARHLLAHAHARLYPPHGPVTSNSSPHAYNPGASFDSIVSGQNSRHFTPPGITYVPPQLFRTRPRVSVHSVAAAPPESFRYAPALRSQRLRRALPSQASARPRPREIVPAARPRHVKQLPARVQPGRELRFQRLGTKLPALRAARYHLCTAAALPNAPTCLRSQRRLRAAGILPIHARAPFTATSPHSFRPGIRSPTPTRDCTRRTAPSCQTAPRTRTTRAQTSIPASPDKTPGTSPRPASPARRRNPSDTRPRYVHSDFAALLPARHPLAHAHARLYPPHGPVTSNSSPHAYTPGASFDSSVSE